MSLNAKAVEWWSLTRLCALQEFAKCCTNPSPALVSQQSPVGMDLGPSGPSAFLAHAGMAGAGQAMVIALTVQHVHQHMHLKCNSPSGCGAPERIADWSSTTTSTRRARGDHGGEMLAPCSCLYAQSLVCPLPCMVGRSWASDWKSYGDAPLQLDAFFSLAGQSS